MVGVVGLLVVLAGQVLQVPVLYQAEKKVGEENTAASPRGSTDEIVLRLEADPNDTFAISRLAASGDARAEAVLRKVFTRADQKAAKQVAASWLVKMDRSDRAHFDLLVGYARSAVESDVPFPGAFDDNGQLIRHRVSEEFIEWCKDRHLDPQVVAQRSVYAYAADVKHLARAEDERAVPILTQGLKSPNYLIVVASAQGLALLKESRALPEILQAVDRVPMDIRRGLALTLLVFDDPVAQATAEKYIGDRVKVRELRKVLSEKGAEALF